MYACTILLQCMFSISIIQSIFIALQGIIPDIYVLFIAYVLFLVQISSVVDVIYMGQV